MIVPGAQNHRPRAHSLATRTGLGLVWERSISKSSNADAHRVHANDDDTAVVEFGDDTPKHKAPEEKDASDDDRTTSNDDQTTPQKARGEMMHEGDFEDPTTTVARRIAAYVDQVCLIICPLVYAIVLARLLDGREVSFEHGPFGEILYSGQVVEGSPPDAA